MTREDQQAIPVSAGIRHDDKGYSKAQVVLGVRSTSCEARNSPQDNPRIMPPQVRYDISIRNIVDSKVPFVAGQLKHFMNEWTKITSDPYILQCISSCTLEFISEPLFATGLYA